MSFQPKLQTTLCAKLKNEEHKPFLALRPKNLQIDTELSKPASNVFSQSTMHNKQSNISNISGPQTVKNSCTNDLQSNNPHHLNSPTHIIGKNNPLPNHEVTKCSYKRNGIVKAYAANTNQGLVRNYNEDRVSIILNITNPNPNPVIRNKDAWPKCSFFGVYDGHGGVSCADFLRDNLHQFVIKDENFPWKPIDALKNGFHKAEKMFIENSLKNYEANKLQNIERSGSCCIVVLIVGNMCYVANVGDSRAVISSHSGIKVTALSRDHKPIDELEKTRIMEAGGKIYQSHGVKNPQNDASKTNSPKVYAGPFRVFPGRLSVSRTFGDIEAKLPTFGGNPKVVIAEPEIKAFQLMPEHEFIVLASDGVYDTLANRDIVKAAWDSLEDSNAQNIHQQCGLAVENILRSAINNKSLDNVTVVLVSFKAFKQKFKLKQQRVLKSNHFVKQENILGDNKNFQNIPLKDERIFNLRKGGSFVAALDYFDNIHQNNENIFKRSCVLESFNFDKFHRTSIDNNNNSKEDASELSKKLEKLSFHKKKIVNVYKK